MTAVNRIVGVRYRVEYQSRQVGEREPARPDYWTLTEQVHDSIEKASEFGKQIVAEARPGWERRFRIAREIRSSSRPPEEDDDSTVYRLQGHVSGAGAWAWPR